MDKVKIGILTLSDRASAGIYEDKATPKLKELLKTYILNECEFFCELLKDDFELIKERLLFMSEKRKCDLIITCGGTGPAQKDYTPEATEAVCQKLLPGFGEMMRRQSLKFVPTAILSRQSAGICQKSLIINLPGNPKAIQECLEPVFSAVPYCIDLIGGAYIHTNEAYIEAFRPKNGS